MLVYVNAKDGFIPTYANKDDVGADLKAYIEGRVRLNPGEWYCFPSGVKIALPHAIGGFVRSRSGLARKHAVVVLGDGTIDPGYRGEIGITLINHGKQPYIVSPGDRIAQLVLVNVSIGWFAQVDYLPNTERGDNGFGSTGV